MLVVGGLAAALDLTHLAEVDGGRVGTDGGHHALQAGSRCCLHATLVQGVLQVGVVRFLKA